MIRTPGADRIQDPQPRCRRTTSTARCARGAGRVRRPGRASRTSSASRSEAAEASGEALDHVLLAGPPGLGKTSLAQIVAAELEVPFVQTAGPALERKADIAAFLTALEPRSVFFVDEIHRLPRAVEETFYPAMEDRQLPITVGRAPARASSRSTCRRSRSIGATTRAGPAHHAAARPLRHPAAPRPLRPGRPGAHRPPLGHECSTSSIEPRAPRPSPSAPAARRAWPTGCSTACATTPRCTAAATIDAARRRRGARPARRSTTRASTASTARSSAICSQFTGGPVGLSHARRRGREEADTIEDVYEPYLLQRGFLHRTPRGRVRDRAGVPPPRARAARERLGAVLSRAFTRARTTLGMQWRTCSSAPTAATASTATDRQPASATNPEGCPKCGFGFLFELLDDYYPAPNAAFFVCDQNGRIIGCGRGSRELTGLADEKVMGRASARGTGAGLRG